VPKDPNEAVPINAVKCLVKVKLEDQSWSIPAVAAVQEIDAISEAICDAAAEDEASLITTDQLSNVRLEPAC
jgi:hypothetical protein